MRLLVLRHGDASLDARSDYERCLTGKGRMQVQQVADYLSVNQMIPETLLVSPYMRTLQTASILQTSFKLPSVRTIQCDDIVPDADPKNVLSLLPSKGRWMIVSHMPFVGRLVSFLVEGHTQGNLSFSTAQLTQLYTSWVMPGCASIESSFVPGEA